MGLSVGYISFPCSAPESCTDWRNAHFRAERCVQMVEIQAFPTFAQGGLLPDTREACFLIIFSGFRETVISSDWLANWNLSNLRFQGFCIYSAAYVVWPGVLLLPPDTRKTRCTNSFLEVLRYCQFLCFYIHGILIWQRISNDPRTWAFFVKAYSPFPIIKALAPFVIWKRTPHLWYQSVLTICNIEAFSPSVTSKHAHHL